MGFLGKYLYRDRRRYLLCWVLLFLTGTMSFWHSTFAPWGIPMPFLGGLAFLIFIGGVLPPLCLALPRYRQACEIVALTLFLWVLASLWIPQLTIENTARDALGMFSFVLAANFIALFFYGRWSDGFARLKLAYLSSHAHTRLPADAIWPRLYTTPRTVTLAADPTIIRVSYLKDGQSRRVLRRVPPGATIEEHHMVRSLTPREHVQIDWHMVDPTPGAEDAAGKLELRLQPTLDGTGVITRRGFPDMPMRRYIALWLDDRFGRVDDTLIARAEEMYARELHEQAAARAERDANAPPPPPPTRDVYR